MCAVSVHTTTMAALAAAVTGASAIIMNKIQITDPAAQCLDGSLATYYFTAGTDSGARKWYIHHQGGGWCQTTAECQERAKTALGSTTADPATTNPGEGYFSADPAANPLMYNWNKVMLRYCDGGSFSGDTDDAASGLHYRGRPILQAMRNALAAQGMMLATDIVISGCSAGGLATFLHADAWAAAFPRARSVALPDSGFFVDADYPHANVSRPGHSGVGLPPGQYHTGMVWVYHAMNASFGVNAACVSHYKALGLDDSACMFAEHTAPHVATPMFVLNSQYDSWQTANILGSKDPTAINAFGQTFRQRMANALGPQHSGFIDSCFHHCGNWNTMPYKGYTQSTAFQQWYLAGSSGGPYVNLNEYPCSSCC